MDREPSEHPLDEILLSPPVRERVLRSCRRAMAERLLAERRRKRWRHGSLAALVALLLLWNAAEEQRIRTRLQGMTAGRSQVAQEPRPDPAALRSLHARATLVAALLRDPDPL